MTRRQAEVLQIIREFHREFGRCPSSRELADAFETFNHSNLYRIITCLVERGHLKRVDRGRVVLVDRGPFEVFRFDDEAKGLVRAGEVRVAGVVMPGKLPRGTKIEGGKIILPEKKPRDASEAVRMKKSKKKRVVSKAAARQFNTIKRG